MEGRIDGAANPTLGGSVGGFKLGQTSSVLSGTPTWTSSATAASNLGQYAIVGGGNGVSYSGFTNGDTSASLGGTLTYGGSSQSARNAGTYAITPGGVTDGSYTISFVNGSLVIGKAPLTLSTGNVTKTYDGTLAAAGTAAAMGGTQLFGTDSLSGGTFAYTNANAGTGNKIVTARGVTLNDGNGGGNYIDNLTSTINPAQPTFTGTVANKTYDATTTATLSGYALSGCVGNQTLDATAGAANFLDPNAGVNKSVTLSGITLQNGTKGGLAANYAVNSTATAVATIDPKTLTVAAVVANEVYDATTAATVTLSDTTIGGDVVNAGYAAATFDNRNVGTNKAVTVNGITSSGAQAGDYIVNSSASTAAIITPATITAVTGITAANKVCDGTTTATLVAGDVGFAGLLPGDTITATATNAVFNSKNAVSSSPIPLAAALTTPQRFRSCDSNR